MRLEMKLSTLTVFALLTACNAAQPVGFDTKSSTTTTAAAAAATDPVATDPTANNPGVTPQTSPLLLTSPSNTMNVGQSMVLSVSGGKPPYALRVTGPGAALSTNALDVANTFTLIATQAGDLQVQATDAAGSIASTVITARTVAATEPSDGDTNGKTPTMTPPPPPPPPPVSMETRVIYGYRRDPMTAESYDGNKFHFDFQYYHLFTESTTPPARYNPTGVSYRLFINQVPGSIALNQCLDAIGKTFESTDAKCEGFTFSRVLGYLYPNPTAGAVALTRYVKTWYNANFDEAAFAFTYVMYHADHLEVTDASQAEAFTAEGVIGYVPTN